MSVNPGLLYASSHEWVRIEGNEAVIGISHFAQDQLGDLTVVELPDVGTALAAGQEMGSVESVKAASEVYSPVAGEVIAVNTVLEDAPELVNQSPYDKGWMVRLRLDGQPGELMNADQYKAFIANA